MNTKLLCSRTAITLTSLAGIVLLTSPVQAFTLTGENTLALSGRAKFNTTSGLLDFREDPGNIYGTEIGTASVTTSSSGRFASLLNQLATLQDITLTQTAGNVWEYTGSTLPSFITVGSIGFELSTFRLVRNPGNDWLATVDGRFQDTGLPALGAFDPLQDDLFTLANSQGASYSFDIEEVPTPALLPGLIGIGVAALRRKKDETAEENA
ncbi:PTPA-CTERM sorting domain-containing protein [Leptolyngbya sp. CCNP1308]|uniref:PTPA-CTERM sorting domain-containing protein n=1 Tax=Leptolyngbya sp. CCNP1308 TaxID=3110255 RepID=UPI002B21A381|nr:PTPA-CTERM sorting domain-containing protein [Leptolyngbya sp. CCNP1308]MEA5448627.1 PTPA-CTERM sorting domain-containing protein [Leptolyngbya sp. CCNP1308]